ncbi:FadR/GntR family transcriptional regulator [Ruania alba]|nr:FCD domain-containing protein [Ruania alba]
MPASDRSDEITASLGSLPGSTPVSEVARRLLDLFTGGSFEPGTRLPAERQLAATLGVGRSAVREALAALEILGIVQVRPGSGTYLRGTASTLLPRTLRWGLLIGEKSTAELLELRSGLETQVAQLAAARASEHNLAALQTAVDQMRQNTGDLSRFAAADHDFHDQLAAASKNETIVDLLHVVRSLLQVYADRAVHDEVSARRALEEHETVLHAISERDEVAAAVAMAAHMATANSRLADEAQA